MRDLFGITSKQLGYMSKAKLREFYAINSNSRFLDIGSGSGRPTIHAALMFDIISQGMEMVSSRV